MELIYEREEMYETEEEIYLSVDAAVYRDDRWECLCSTKVV